MPSYEAFVFRQVSKGPIQLAFVATSADIDRWAKVPTKMSRKPAAFQRPALESHVADVRTFFLDPSKANSSPTAIVIGLEPEAAASVELLQSKDGPLLDEAAVSEVPQICWVEIDFEPWPSGKYGDDTTREIADLYEAVKGLYETGTATSASTVDSITDAEEEEIQPDDADEEEEEEDDDGEDDSPDEDDGDDVSPAELGSPQSTPKAGRTVSPDKIEERRVKHYFDRLAPNELARICAAKDYADWSPAQQRALRDLLKDDRKPGLIIDGQHRVKGTALQKVPFLVSFLPRAPWAELAFQFIVNNGSAKKVGEGLLISIVGESLAPEQLREIEERLYRAKIKVSLIQAVMRVQAAANAFSGMLEFNVPGELGFLEAPAMQKKVVKLWYGTRDPSGHSGKFAKLNVKERTPLSMKDMFGGSCAGSTIKERINDWQDQATWFQYFSAFWDAVAEHFRPRLWPATQADWPKKSRLASPADKERLKLMRVTVLGILQEAVLIAWATGVVNERKRKFKKKTNMAEYKISSSDFKAAIAGYLGTIPPDFFTEMTYTGFDGSRTLRDDLRNQMLKLLEGHKEFADIRAEHKFWK